MVLGEQRKYSATSGNVIMSVILSPSLLSEFLCSNGIQHGLGYR
jgi:hypothetical protein